MTTAAAAEDSGGLHAVKSSDRLSVLGKLSSRREEVLAERTIPLRVPGWTEPEIFVRFKPVPHPILRKAMNTAERSNERKRGEAEVAANCDVLINGCEAVVAILDGKEYSLRPNDSEGEPTVFDEDLAANLGCEANARAVVKALYITDGDIISTATKIAEFSGYRDAEVMEQIEGE